MRDQDRVPEFIPVLSRTSSDDFTSPMYMIDHRCSRQDGPPEIPDFFVDEEDTNVDCDTDTIIYEVAWYES